jgi:hypothetical protein
MRITDVASAARRPTRSPTAPRTIPPSGRMKNAIPNTASAESSAPVGDAEGKKTFPIVVAKKP